MHRTDRRPVSACSLLLVLVALIGLAAWPTGAASAPTPQRTLLPIGSGYTGETLRSFAQAAAEHDTTGNAGLLVLPITFGLGADATSPSERRKNLDLADRRRG